MDDRHGDDASRELAEHERRRVVALAHSDDVVQELAVAHYALELGNVAGAKIAVEAALAASRRVISDLAGSPASPNRLRAGDLTRPSPAGDDED